MMQESWMTRNGQLRNQFELRFTDSSNFDADVILVCDRDDQLNWIKYDS